MKKPNIKEVKTLKKFSVKKQFIVEVSVEIYAESEYEAEKIANEKLTPVEDNSDSVSWDCDSDTLDAYGDCPLMDNVKVSDVWAKISTTQRTTNVDKLNDVVVLLQCEEDNGSNNVNTLFTDEEDAINYWKNNYNS